MIHQIFKSLSIWTICLTLSSVSFAESSYQMLNQKLETENSNQKIIQFLAEFNKAKIVRDLLPLIPKYLVDEKNKTFFKNQLHSYMLTEAPELQLQGDLVTLIFESHKRTIKMRLNLQNSKLYVKDKIIDLKGLTGEQLTTKLTKLKLVSSNSSFSLINEAHAALVLGLLAVAGISALVVGILGLLSSWSKKSCFGRYEDVFRTFETAEINCLNDKASVMESPGSNEQTETYQYIKSVKRQMKVQHNSSNNCKKEVSEHFRYFSFYRKKPCVPKARVGEMCQKMKTLETCLREYEKLDTASISSERLKIKLQNKNQNTQHEQNKSGEQ